MKKIVLTLILLSTVALNNVSACSCIGKETVKQARKSSDAVVVGTIIKVDEIKVWTDTSNARAKYDNGNYEVSYKEYLWDHINYGRRFLEYTVIVNKKFKLNSSQDTIKVRTGFGGGDCGFKFKFNQDYLIYAVEESSINYTMTNSNQSKKELKGVYRTGICDRTNAIEFAKEDLRILN